jgi:hypothetical protein
LDNDPVTEGKLVTRGASLLIRDGRFESL